MRRPQNRSRAVCVAKWLCEHFGEQVLQAGSGVVDVAGGSGELSFQLCTLRGIECSVIDPRPSLSLHKHIQRYGTYQRNKAKVGVTAFKVSLQGLTVETGLEVKDDSSHSDTAAAPPVSTAEEPMPQAKLPVHFPFTFPLSSEQQELEQRLQRHAALQSDGLGAPDLRGQMWKTLKDASLLVGLHSDDATEPLVDFALKHGKAFAVLPCCVFPKRHTARRLASGAPVTSYEDFCAYLQGKERTIRKHVLPFEGRNVVLYWDGTCAKRSAALNEKKESV